MTEWRVEIEEAVRDFLSVATLAGDPISRSEIRVEFRDAPHSLEKALPAGMMAVYGFWFNGAWLKIGKAGPNSSARYRYQHYSLAAARSTLAASLVADPTMATLFDPDRGEVGDWIKASTSRVNILISSERRPELLSLLEAFLHLRLRPRYEG